MTKLLITAAIAAALGLPSIAVAQTGTDASVVCRPVSAGESANGTIQNAQYLCRPLKMDKIRDAMKSVMAGVSPAEKAKLDFAMQVFEDELKLLPNYPGYNQPF